MTGFRSGPDGAGTEDCSQARIAHIAQDSMSLRRALGQFCSGITVVASVVDSIPIGLTCQSFFSLSLEPPLVALAASKSSTSFPLVRARRLFSVNVLADHQRAVSAALAHTGVDKWAGIEWHAGRHGQPILPGSLVSLECRLETVHETGDHYLVVGEVLDLNLGERAQPLLYFRGEYREVAAAHSAVPC